MSSGAGPSLTRREVLLGGTVALAWSGVAAVFLGGGEETSASEPGDDDPADESGGDPADESGGDPADESGGGGESGPAAADPAVVESGDNRTTTPAPGDEREDVRE